MSDIEDESEKCNKCGKEYEGYPIFIRNNALSYTMYLEEKEYVDEEYDGIVCRECRKEIRKKLFDVPKE